MNQAGKQYLRELGLASVAYAVVLIIAITLINRLPGSPWRVPLALLPVIPAGFMLVALVRFLERIDELQRRIQLEAIALSAGATAIVTFAYGFLELVGFPHLPLIWIFPLMIVLWGISLAISSRRYQ